MSYCLSMVDQEPRDGTYGTVGATYGVAIRWKVISPPPDEITHLNFRFEAWNLSTGAKILDSPSLEALQSIPAVGEGYWTWCRDSFIQPDATVKIRATANGYKWVGASLVFVQIIGVFEWVAHPIRVGPSYGRVEFNVVWINEIGSSVPIEDALCKLDTKYQAWTNKYGKALIDGITPGSYLVSIEKDGFKKYTGTVYVGAGKYVTISAILAKEEVAGESQATIYSNVPVMMTFNLSEMMNSVLSLMFGITIVSTLFSAIQEI